MEQVLSKVREVDPNNSEAVKIALSGFFLHLPKYTASKCYLWLVALENVINRFPKYCMTHRSTIESYLINFLDSSNHYLVIEAAKCGHSLQQVRPSQEKAATPKTSWREQTSLLVNAAHLLIAAIFPNAADIYNTNDQNQDCSISTTPLSIALSNITEISKTNGSTIDYDVQDRQNLLCLRLKNIFVFLQAMLVEAYPVAKPIRPQMILDVLVRALTASTSAGRAAPADVSAIKAEALRTLDALILCLGSNLLPYSPLVFRLAMQTLRWTSDNSNEESSRAVRVQAYSSLSIWLGALRCHRPEGGGAGRGAGRGALEDELLAAAVGDVTPARHLVHLTMNSQPTKNLSKKAKRKLASTMLQESAIAGHAPGARNQLSGPVDNNEDLAIAALECLEMFLTVCGIFLKPTTHKVIQERLLRACYSGVHGACSGARLLRVLRALEAARRAPPRAAPAACPAPRALQLHAALLTSSDPEISKFCSEALLNMRLQLHCAPPTISYSLEPPKENEITPEVTKKGISERNRAALQQLLGAHKLPPSAKDEVITIEDEPTSKKAKLSQDLETENISVSSQSSVEISDDDDDEIEIQEVEEIENEEEVVMEPNVVEVLDQNLEETELLVIENVEKENVPRPSIHELNTQIHASLSNDTTDGRETPIPHSLEVEYDYNTGKSKVTVLEKMDEDNLPSTNETDDIQITCGQIIKSSQEAFLQKKQNEPEDVPKVNGDNESTVDVNGLDTNENVTETVTVKIAATDAVTVDDMLADFVDEVNEEGVEV